MMALSSALVATGFVANSPDILLSFAAVVLPTIFLLGLFTVFRLVEATLESIQYLHGIARIRGYYRTLGPEAARQFAPEYGRWPEIQSPALRLGPVLAFYGTTGSIIEVFNDVVEGCGLCSVV